MPAKCWQNTGQALRDGETPEHFLLMNQTNGKLI